jgi:sugar diacid utilization regulator
MTELQQIVDSLARSTKRAVSVHDRSRRLLAFSSQDETIDEVRKESILTRKGPERGFAWARRFGIEDAADPVRIPANDDLGMGARVCAPVRFDGRLLGFLWLMDPDETLPDESMDLVRSSASAAGLAIQQGELLELIDRGRERELLRDLLSDAGDVRAHAVHDLIEGDLLVPSDVVAVFVLRPVREREGMTPADTAVRSRVERALSRSRYRIAPHQALQLVRPDHGVLLVTCAKRDVRGLRAIGEELLAALPPADGWSAVVGIGSPQADLVDAHVSYVQARKGAEVCGVLSSIGPVATWDDLGVYRTLLQVPLSQVDFNALHPGLAKLLEARESNVWLQTLECYLDLGCDARAAAKTLHVNRSTLYHRIHRIEQIAGVDLNSGDDRLALHLGMKLARLGGLLEAPSPGADGAAAPSALS